MFWQEAFGRGRKRQVAPGSGKLRQDKTGGGEGEASPLHLLTCFTGLNQAAFIRRPACLKTLPTFTLFLSELHARVKEHVRRRAKIYTLSPALPCSGFITSPF